MTAGLAGLRIGRHGDDVLEFLNQHLVFVAFDIDIAHGIGREGAGGDVALGLAIDTDIARCWHDLLLETGKCLYKTGL